MHFSILTIVIPLLSSRKDPITSDMYVLYLYAIGGKYILIKRFRSVVELRTWWSAQRGALLYL